MTPPMPPAGLILAAPASNSGKTTLTLALLRHLRESGCRVGSAKCGPDYIDPAFHAAAGGRPCRNLDVWAMRPDTLAMQALAAGRDCDLVVVEGVMGLFDGTSSGNGTGGNGTGGNGSTAELALATGWPVVLVVDVKGQATSAAATVLGFDRFRPDLRLAGVIFNRVGGDKHEAMLRAACAPLGIPVLGAVRRHPELTLPDRHLGLVQAAEHPDLGAFLNRAAARIAMEIDIEALHGVARPLCMAPPVDGRPGVPPPGQRVAVARDVAFTFAYDWLLESWHRAGVEILPFSPLADQAPPMTADSVYLPGGYPELHAGKLAGNAGFLAGLRATATGGKTIFGECGGYMVLGRGMVDREGVRHRMAGLLGLESSFARRKLHLGYRRAVLTEDGPLGCKGTVFRGHEFHFAGILEESSDRPLFRCRDAADNELGPAGERRNSIAGSFIHLIDRQLSDRAS